MQTVTHISLPADIDLPTAGNTAEQLHGPGAWYQQYGYQLALAAAFLLPLKMAIAYIALLPLILIWLFAAFKDRNLLSSGRKRPYLLMGGFFAVVVGASFAGIAPLSSLKALISLVFFSCSILIYEDLVRKKGGFTGLAAALVAGQTIAALHTAFNAVLGGALRSWFLGEVTESGQLALTLFVCLALAAHCRDRLRAEGTGPVRWQKVAWVIAAFALIVSCAFEWHESALLRLGALVAVLGAHSFAAIRWTKDSSMIQRVYMGMFWSLPILSAALVLNLKRGPWLGVFIALGLFCVLRARWLLLPTVLVAGLSAVLFSPVLDRLLQSGAHFTLAGGRQTIWQVGVELASRYPLGIGLDNSAVLRDFSVDIPRQLTHFHNNLINITVETGWLGVVLFVAWLTSLFARAYRTGQPAQLLLGAALLAWQIAGLVEYNFGDSEVLLVAFLVMGLLLGTSNPNHAAGDTATGITGRLSH